MKTDENRPMIDHQGSGGRASIDELTIPSKEE
jgi:hypothetical protein